MNTETAIKRRGSADRLFYLLAAISLLLVLLIAADGVRKGLDTIIPDYYRHKASVAIAVSELAHGTSGFVGLVEVEQALGKVGLGTYPDRARMIIFHAHPEQADAALRAAADLSISDRSKTFGLLLNETGMVDYYYLAFKLFGYHVRSIYALYIGILGIMTLCFIDSFRHRAIFIVPAILYLFLLLIGQDALRSNNFDFGPLTNSRMLPFLSLYAVLFCLTLIASSSIRPIASTSCNTSPGTRRIFLSVTCATRCRASPTFCSSAVPRTVPQPKILWSRCTPLAPRRPMSPRLNWTARDLRAGRRNGTRRFRNSSRKPTASPPATRGQRAMKSGFVDAVARS